MMAEKMAMEPFCLMMQKLLRRLPLNRMANISGSDTLRSPCYPTVTTFSSMDSK